MILRSRMALMVLVVFLFVGAVQAQEQITVSIAEHPEFGTYLTDGEGMTLYLFVQDAAALATPMGELEPMTEGVRPEAAVCVDDCLATWPPLLAEEGSFALSPEAEGVIDAERLYVADVDGRQQLVYNGWPLYYFANDTQAGDVNGQGIGNRWFVVAPEGGAAGEVAGGGAAEPAPPAEEPAAPGEEPAAPGEEPAAPGEEPAAPGEEPAAPGEEPAAPGEEPAAPGEEPAAPGGEDEPAAPGGEEEPAAPGNAG